MVAPLIAAGARTAAGGVKNATKVTGRRSAAASNKEGKRHPRRIVREKRHQLATQRRTFSQTTSENIVADAQKSIRTWRAFWFSVTASLGMTYPIQIFFAILSFIGFGFSAGIDSSSAVTFLNSVTFNVTGATSSGMYVVGGAGAALCGLASAVITLAIFTFHKLNPFPGTTIGSLAVMLVLLLIPVINFFPWPVLWIAHVTWGNLKD